MRVRATIQMTLTLSPPNRKRTPRRSKDGATYAATPIRNLKAPLQFASKRHLSQPMNGRVNSTVPRRVGDPSVKDFGLAVVNTSAYGDPQIPQQPSRR